MEQSTGTLLLLLLLLMLCRWWMGRREKLHRVMATALTINKSEEDSAQLVRKKGAWKKAQTRYSTPQPLTPRDHTGHLLPVPALGLSLVSTLILSFRSTCSNASEPRFGFVVRFKSPYSIHEGPTNRHEDSKVCKRSTEHFISRSRSRSSSRSRSAVPA
jgi:hypothetical protein